MANRNSMPPTRSVISRAIAAWRLLHACCGLAAEEPQIQEETENEISIDVQGSIGAPPLVKGLRRWSLVGDFRSLGTVAELRRQPSRSTPDSGIGKTFIAKQMPGSAAKR